MNQGRLEVVTQEMVRVNINILGTSELRWTGMGEFNSEDHYIYYCGQESLRRNGVAIIVNKESEVQNLGTISKMSHSASQESKCMPATDAKEAGVDQFCEELQDFLELTTMKCPFYHRGLECKSRKSRDTWSNRQVWPWTTK